MGTKNENMKYYQEPIEVERLVPEYYKKYDRLLMRRTKLIINSKLRAIFLFRLNGAIGYNDEIFATKNK
jgi:hypothetical protein